MKFWSDTFDPQAIYCVIFILAFLEIMVHFNKIVNLISGAGLGVFAKEFIPSGTSYRILKANQNLVILNGPEDIPPLTDVTKQYLTDYCAQTDGICYFMCPGSTVNHHKTESNTAVKKFSESELHSYAIRDLQVGDELFCDYVDFGTPPKWLAEFVKLHKIPLPFDGFNDFVEK